MRSNIFITGFSGSGKTTVGEQVAQRLGWPFVDTDDEIVAAGGKSIEDIFSEMGEAEFRKREHERLTALCERECQVVSTGGGMIMDERNRGLMEHNGIVVYLDARPDTIFERLERQRTQAEGSSVRPMLAADDRLARIRSLKDKRQANYAKAHWTVHTDRLTPAEVAAEVLRGWEMLKDRTTPEQRDGDEPAAVVRTSSGNCPVWVGWGILEELGERVRRVLSPHAAYVITDEGVQRHAREAQVSMEAAGIPTQMFVVPAGEQSKTLETAQHIYAWLAEGKAERGHLILAVGGGMIGDLAGYVAATYLRGMPLVQVPTSLLAMMDSSIGGKVAVDLPQGKNLVGAFHQPTFVLTDVHALETLPGRELASGWAEALKHGLILDRTLVETFEQLGPSIRSLDPGPTTDVIRRSVAIKADIVSRDEKETLGIRALLNYGHTIGHAIEAATGYGTFLHGEAVSVGMMGAAFISNVLGRLSAGEVERQRALLESYGLPTACAGVDTAAVSEAMLSDKKTVGKSIRWVLLDSIGTAVTETDVPGEVVQDVLGRLSRQPNASL